MKKHIALLLIAAFAAAVFAGCAGKPKESPASDFEYEIKDGKVTITRYIGKDADVVIPAQIEGKPVAELRWMRGDSDAEESVLKTVVIPDSVTTISASCFSNCQKLESVKFGAGLKTIHERAFSNCSSLVRIELPEGLTFLGNRAFEKCTSLQYVFVPSTLTGWHGEEFIECGSLTDIVFAEGIETIGNVYSFASASALKKIVIPASVKKICDYTFTDCKALESVEFEGDAPIIGNYAFDGSDALVIYYKSTASGWDNKAISDVYDTSCIDG
jgi:hypothetical protein